ncbi:MAG TPA: DsbA family protein [Blastocatellia bacterium]|nr:DsbA family protein [Blastocatellia bacterium]
MGEASLKNAVRVTGAETIFRAFLLRADGPPKFDPQSESFAALFRNNVLPLAAAFGVEIHQPSRLPLTRAAHEAAAWARTQGRFDDYHQALFRALYIEDRDFSEIETLREIARSLGLNAADLEKSLHEGRMADEVDEDLLIAQTYGLSGVPAYVIGGHTLFGVQDETTLIEAIRRADRHEPAPKAGPLPSLPISITRK